MKRLGVGTFKKSGGKWSAVSVKIRNLYDSVLKEAVPQNLRASTQINPPSGPKETMAKAEPSNMPEIAEPDSSVTEASDISNAPISIEQGETSSSLPDQSNIKTGDSKN